MKIGLPRDALVARGYLYLKGNYGKIKYLGEFLAGVGCSNNFDFSRRLYTNNKSSFSYWPDDRSVTGFSGSRMYVEYGGACTAQINDAEILNQKGESCGFISFKDWLSGDLYSDGVDPSEISDKYFQFLALDQAPVTEPESALLQIDTSLLATSLTQRVIPLANLKMLNISLCKAEWLLPGVSVLQWNLPKDLNHNELKAYTAGAVDYLGRSQQYKMAGYPDTFNKFPVGHRLSLVFWPGRKNYPLKLSVHYGDDWVPLLNDFPNYIAPAPDRSPGRTRYIVIPTTFSATQTLYIYPLPGNTKSFELEYRDVRLEPEVKWEKLNDAVLTKRGIAVNVTHLEPSQYPYRLKLLDAKAQPIEIKTSTKEQKNGWIYGKFSFNEAGNQYIPTPMEQKKWLRPKRKQTLDRWGNTTSITDEKGELTAYAYNRRDQKLVQIKPVMCYTKSDGTEAKGAPITRWGYDLSRKVIAEKNPLGNTRVHIRNRVGGVLKTMQADGAYQAFVLDGFNNNAVKIWISFRMCG